MDSWRHKQERFYVPKIWRKRTRTEYNGGRIQKEASREQISQLLSGLFIADRNADINDIVTGVVDLFGIDIGLCTREATEEEGQNIIVTKNRLFEITIGSIGSSKNDLKQQEGEAGRDHRGECMTESQDASPWGGEQAMYLW